MLTLQNKYFLYCVSNAWYRVRLRKRLSEYEIYPTTAAEHFGAWWRYQMETVSVLLAICAGNSLVPGEFPTQRPITRNFDVFFDLRPIKTAE